MTEEKLKKQHANRGPDGKFIKGASGNPGGKSKTAEEYREGLKENLDVITARLLRIIKKGKSETAAIQACRELLDRIYGKPNQELDIQGKFETGPIEVVFVPHVEQLISPVRFALPKPDDDEDDEDPDKEEPDGD